MKRRALDRDAVQEAALRSCATSGRARASCRTSTPRSSEPIACIGHRITGRRTGAINRHHGIGRECLQVCIYDACRLAYGEILADERKETATGFPERALARFAGHGVGSSGS
jgi:hypothetical protein